METPTEDALQPQPETPDYKEKFVHSQRESILNAERVKVAQSRIESLTKQDTPTDEAMRQLYPEWDELNEVTKKAFLRQEAQEMRQHRLEEQNRILLERQNLDDQLDAVIENPKYAPKLVGKESDFKRFARNPKNRGVSAEVLAQAFLFDVEDETPTTPNPQPMPKEALPVGSGGPRGPVKPKKIPLEEAANIRKTNYKRYMELVKAGAIEDDID